MKLLHVGRRRAQLTGVPAGCAELKRTQKGGDPVSWRPQRPPFWPFFFRSVCGGSSRSPALSVARCGLLRLVLALGCCCQLWRSVLRIIVFPLAIAALVHWNKNSRFARVLHSAPPVTARSSARRRLKNGSASLSFFLGGRPGVPVGQQMVSLPAAGAMCGNFRIQSAAPTRRRWPAGASHGQFGRVPPPPRQPAHPEAYR